MWEPRYLIFMQDITLLFLILCSPKMAIHVPRYFTSVCHTALSLQKGWQLWAGKRMGGGTAQAARPQHFKDGCTLVRISSLCPHVMTATSGTSASLSCQGSTSTVTQKVLAYSVTAHRKMSPNAWTPLNEGLLRVLWPVRGLGKKQAEQARWSTSHPPPLATVGTTLVQDQSSDVHWSMAWGSSVVQTSFLSGVMLVSMLSRGKGNYSFLEVCWEPGCRYRDGDVTPKPGSAVQVHGQTQDTLQGCCKGGVVAVPISQRHHSRHWVHCAVNVVCTIRELILEVLIM